MTIKVCSVCGLTKSAEDFPRHRKCCKKCRSSNVLKWQKQNQEKHTNYQKSYKNQKYKNDINFRLRCVLRARLHRAIKNKFKSGSAVDELGCDINFFKSYLESRFQIGMNWDNWGVLGWQIDHIVPLNSFDLSNPKELKVACHYTNMQPMWYQANASKSDKI